MRLKFIAIALVISAFLIAGCGSSGSSGSGSSDGNGNGTSAGGTESTDGSTSGGEDATGKTGKSASGKPLSKAEYIQEGDAICAKVPNEYNAKVKALEAEAKKQKKPKPSKAETNVKAAVPPLYLAVGAMEELTPPQGDEQEAEAIVAALESAAKGLEENPEAGLSGPKSPFAEFQKLTKAYGYRSCSQL